MRRLTTALMGAAITLASVVGVTATASAAGPGTITETSAASALPSSVAGIRASRITRLSRTGEFLAVGRTATDGSKYYMWQIKPDNSLDTSFGTNGLVDLGISDTTPCSLSNVSVTTCTRVNNVTYNETSNTYQVSLYRSLKTTSYMHYVTTVIIGDLKTGAVKSTTNLREYNGMLYSAQQDTEFATLGITAQNLGKAECTAARGASINGAPLYYGTTNLYGAFIVPNGDIVVSFYCRYSSMYDANGNSVNPSGALKEYTATHYTAFKVVNNALTVDTTWGTNGRYLPVADPSTTCDMGAIGGYSTVDLGVTSMSSTKPFTLVSVSTTPLSTTLQSYLGNSGWTSYSGCGVGGGPGTTYSNKIYALTANGKAGDAMDLGTSTSVPMPTRWVIDPAGRWVTLARVMSVSNGGSVAPAVTYNAVRVANGKLDATFGTNGQKTLSSMTTSVTVNGTPVTVNYILNGIITTADEVLFSGTTSSQTWNPSNAQICSSSSNSAVATTETRPFIFSMKTGDIVKTFGTSGLGDATTYLMSNADACGNIGGATFVNAKGQPASLRMIPAQGSQALGMRYSVWETIAGVTGGGEGGTGTGGATKDTGGAAFTGEKAFSAGVAAGAVAGRVDTKVYATAPAKVQENSAVSVLTADQADDLDLVSTTPAVCVALTTTVVFTGTGKCNVRIIDEETRKVIRTFSTTVAKSEQVAGTVLTTDKPIYFRFVSSALTAKAKAQIAALAEKATGVGRILIVGHSASLYDNEISNKRIALNRAAAVKAALAKAGVKAPISIVSVGSADPVTKVKTETAQAKNRRVEIFFFPSAG